MSRRLHMKFNCNQFIKVIDTQIAQSQFNEFPCVSCVSPLCMSLDSILSILSDCITSQHPIRSVER